MAQPTQLINLFISWVLFCKYGNNYNNVINWMEITISHKSGVVYDIEENLFLK